MIFVTGGVFQHKLDFIYEKFALTENDVGTKIIYKFNHIVKNWIEENKNIEEETKRFIENNKDSIVVLDQVGCGIVPVDKKEEVYRECAGRAGCIIAENSDEVYNVVFGLGIKIKG